MSETQTPEQKVRRQLLKAGPGAVRFLVGAMDNEELPYKERIDIAKDILNRGFGKTAPADEGPPALRVVLAEEAAPYAD